ncbi:MAG: hypothetical protein ACUVQH_15240 [Thermogutta sp.]
MLLTARFDHREHGFHQVAVRSALRAEGQLPPDHRVSQRTLTRIVSALSQLKSGISSSTVSPGSYEENPSKASLVDPTINN